MAGQKLSVLVTGGNGFIACHVIAQLLEGEHEVTAVVRSEEKAKQLLKTRPEWEGKVEFGYVPELTASDAFAKLFDKEYDIIMHTASPVAFKVNDVKTDLIDPAIQGTTGLLEAAHKLGGPNLKRFILLGSAVAVLNSYQDESAPGKDYTEDDWNPVTAEEAIKTQDPVLGYNASKKLAEQAAWNFMKTENPGFHLVVINPDIVIGPMLHPVPGPGSVNETNRFTIYNFMDGTYDKMESIKFPFYHFVDVRDVANAHNLAMTASGALNKRILLVSGSITPQLVANLIHKNFPDLGKRVIVGRPSQIFPDGVQPTNWDVKRSHEIFGPEWSYRTLESSLVDTIRDILLHENQWA